MSTNLKRFMKVTYESEEAARHALRAAETKFYSGVQTLSQNLNRVEGKSVYFVKALDNFRDRKVLHFLLSQEGALPAGCHVM